LSLSNLIKQRGHQRFTIGPRIERIVADDKRERPKLAALQYPRDRLSAESPVYPLLECSLGLGTQAALRPGYDGRDVTLQKVCQQQAGIPSRFRYPSSAKASLSPRYRLSEGGHCMAARRAA